MTTRRFPPPWTAEVTPNCFIVRDADGQQLAETQIYFRWCFSDSATARAFIEQFGGELNI